MKHHLPRLVRIQRQSVFAGLGMSLIEVIIAMMLLVAFFGVFVAVTEFTSRFMRESEAGVPGSQGALLDQQALQLAMDQLADVLAQPGLSLSDLRLIQSKGCVYDPMSGLPDATSKGWGLPGRALRSPDGYRFCLESTSLTEPPMAELLAGGKPGIYLIKAIPDQISAAAIPARRLFCRPKPFC